MKLAGGSVAKLIFVPFQPSASVASFKDEIVKRAIRQNLHITPESHALPLRLQSQTGPTIDSDLEDVLSDVVLTSKTIFAVFSQRNGHVTALPSHISQDTSAVMSAAVSGESAAEPIEGESIRVRVVTLLTAKRVRSSLELSLFLSTQRFSSSMSRWHVV
jgi:hypothetical protein